MVEDAFSLSLFSNRVESFTKTAVHVWLDWRKALPVTAWVGFSVGVSLETITQSKVQKPSVTPLGAF